MFSTIKKPKSQTQNGYRRWETATRWYEVFVMQDLFGDWTVTRVWGGKGAKTHGQRVEVAATWAEALAIVERIHQRRIKRHPPYVVVE